MLIIRAFVHRKPQIKLIEPRQLTLFAVVPQPQLSRDLAQCQLESLETIDARAIPNVLSTETHDLIGTVTVV